MPSGVYIRTEETKKRIGLANRKYHGESCLVEECPSLAKTKKFCQVHYLRMFRYGRLERRARVLNGKYRSSSENNNWYRFGGKKMDVLERDGWRCLGCKMTNEEHKKKWNCILSVDHIDGNGIYSKNPNNDINNLQTLCLRCHGLKEAKFRHRKVVNYLICN